MNHRCAAHCHAAVWNDVRPQPGPRCHPGWGRRFDHAFHRLAGELSDEVEVLAKVQYGLSSEFSSRGDEIRYRRSTTLAPVREEGRDLDCQRSSRSATGFKTVSEPSVDLVRSR